MRWMQGAAPHRAACTSSVGLGVLAHACMSYGMWSVCVTTRCGDPWKQETCVCCPAAWVCMGMMAAPPWRLHIALLCKVYVQHIDTNMHIRCSIGCPMHPMARLCVFKVGRSTIPYSAEPHCFAVLICHP